MGKMPNEEVTNHQCDICEKYYFSEVTLWHHKKDKHKDKLGTPIVTDFQCELCDKYFLGRISLRIHMKNIHEKKRRKLKCAVCNKNFPSTYRFWEHCRSHLKVWSKQTNFWANCLYKKIANQPSNRIYQLRGHFRPPSRLSCERGCSVASPQ